MNKPEDYNLTITKCYYLEKINNDKYALYFPEINNCVQQVSVNHKKFREKAILKTFSKAKLRHLIARCEEVLKEKIESEG